MTDVPRTLLLVVVFWLGGCAPRPDVPVIEQSFPSKPQAVEYVVSRGDTLYSIAWRFDRDYRELARLNGIGSPYLLHPGQRLTLEGPAVAAAPPARALTPKRASPPAASRRSVSPRAAPPSPAKPTTWRWPAKGQVARAYGRGNKGVDFELGRGERVVAAAGGEVVYAGGGLRGYRRLVIIKHDQRYLSAYSLNHEVDVKEGQAVEAGAILARLGAPVGLHFEIRRNGDPVDPSRVIGGR